MKFFAIARLACVEGDDKATQLIADPSVELFTTYAVIEV
jgi:hypothetical protein